MDSEEVTPIVNEGGDEAVNADDTTVINADEDATVVVVEAPEPVSEPEPAPVIVVTDGGTDDAALNHERRLTQAEGEIGRLWEAVNEVQAAAQEAEVVAEEAAVDAAVAEVVSEAVAEDVTEIEDDVVPDEAKQHWLFRPLSDLFGGKNK